MSNFEELFKNRGVPNTSDVIRENLIDLVRLKSKGVSYKKSYQALVDDGRLCCTYNTFSTTLHRIKKEFRVPSVVNVE